MPHTHEHRDFKCPECGELVTCLSCLEIHAAELPRGPGFPEARYSMRQPDAPVFQTIDITNEFEFVEPQNNGVPPLPSAATSTQQSLFA